jgi:cytochrome c oxidase cbb3-type subunit IV
MDLNHDSLVWLSKSIGLLYLVGLSVVIVAYAYWPSNRQRFERAAEAILEYEDRPWR